MSIPDFRYEVLRRLARQYLHATEPLAKQKIFTKILRRVDHLVLFKLHEMCNRRFWLDKEDFDELYRTGVVGVGRALKIVREHEDGRKICLKIQMCIQREISERYPYPIGPKSKVIKYVSMNKESIAANIYGLVVDDFGPQQIELQDQFDHVVDCLYKAFHKRKITERDVHLFLDRYKYGYTFRKLCKLYPERKKDLKQYLLSILWKVRKYALKDNRKEIGKELQAKRKNIKRKTVRKKGE